MKSSIFQGLTRHQAGVKLSIILLAMITSLGLSAGDTQNHTFSVRDPYQKLTETLAAVDSEIQQHQKRMEPLSEDQLKSWQENIETEFYRWITSTEVPQKSTKNVQDAAQLITALFRLKKAAKQTLMEAPVDTPPDQLQKFIRELRYLEDYTAEYAFLKPSQHFESSALSALKFAYEKTPMLESSPQYLFLNANGTPTVAMKSELLPGDVLVTRGVSYLSAMIAALGSYRGQYSHVAFVSKNPENTNGALETIESYVGKGVVHFNLEEALRFENSRILWLRHESPTLAREASDLTMAFVLAAERLGRKIPYDYDLNFYFPDAFSCAEITKFAYSTFTNSNYPKFESKINPNNQLVKLLKLKSTHMFSPGDIELDPRFHIMGEWRDLRLTRDSRIRDLSFEKLFDALENNNSFRKTLSSRMIPILWALRKTPLWKITKKISDSPDFSKEVPPKMLRALYFVNRLGPVLYDYVLEKDQESLTNQNRFLTPNEIRSVLSEWFERDLKLYSDKKTRRHSVIYKNYLKISKA